MAAQIASAEVMTPSAFGLLSGYDIVIVGELHDNKVHHDNQAAIASKIAPKALVFEMLSPEQVDRARGVPHDNMNALEEALAWSETSWPSFALYFPIFAAAPEARLYGAEIPIENVKEAVRSGAVAQFGRANALYGLDAPLNPHEQKVRETFQAEAHCNALPEPLLPGMVEAQRLRDASFARTTLQALEETGGPVLVITGNGHARTDWGMPRYLKRANPDATIASVGQILAEENDPPYDFWIVTGDYTPANGDPCAAFK